MKRYRQKKSSLKDNRLTRKIAMNAHGSERLYKDFLEYVSLNYYISQNIKLDDGVLIEEKGH